MSYVTVRLLTIKNETGIIVVAGIIDKRTKVERKLAFLDDLSQSFQCVICKSTAKTPVVSPCCQRVVGCESCVNNWVSSQSQQSRCPLCSTSGSMLNRFALKGFNDALKIIRGTTLEAKVTHSCLCTFWHVIPTSPFSFNDFSFLFPYFFGQLHYEVKNILIKCNQKY